MIVPPATIRDRIADFAMTVAVCVVAGFVTVVALVLSGGRFGEIGGGDAR